MTEENEKKGIYSFKYRVLYQISIEYKAEIKIYSVNN